LQAAFPEIEKSTRVFLDYLIFQKDQNDAQEEKIAYADSSLFSVFTLPLISGNPNVALDAPNSLVLSESAAHKYFGTADPLGKTLKINGNTTATVTGVMQDMPQNAHFRVDILVSIATLGSGWEGNWKRFFFHSYLLLPEDCNTTALSQKMAAFVGKHLDQSQGKYALSLEPLRDVYLYGKARGSRSGSSANGSISNVYIFSLIAAFVLFIASFNFINLTTAFATQRQKEVGVRKVLGGRATAVDWSVSDGCRAGRWSFVWTGGRFVRTAVPVFQRFSGQNNHYRLVSIQPIFALDFCDNGDD